MYILGSGCLLRRFDFSRKTGEAAGLEELGTSVRGITGRRKESVQCSLLAKGRGGGVAEVLPENLGGVLQATSQNPITLLGPKSGIFANLFMT